MLGILKGEYEQLFWMLRISFKIVVLISAASFSSVHRAGCLLFPLLDEGTSTACHCLANTELLILSPHTSIFCNFCFEIGVFHVITNDELNVCYCLCHGKLN